MRVVAGAVAALALMAGPAWAAPRSTAESPRAVQRFSDPRLEESSGLAVSARHPGLLWTVADSGNPAVVYGVRGGRVVAVARLTGATNVDWEALAPDPRGTLWVGDIGDNDAVRGTVVVYAIPEPRGSGSSALRPRAYRLRYPDGPHDAEALLVDPSDGTVTVVTKQLLGAAYYSAGSLRRGRVSQLRRVATAPPIVTDGAWAPDGRRLALRGYTGATLYHRPGGAGTDLALPSQPLGESLAWTSNGRALLVGSEGRDSTVWQVPLPAGPGTSGGPIASADPPRAVADALAGQLGVVRVAALAALALALLGGLLAYRSRRRR